MAQRDPAYPKAYLYRRIVLAKSYIEAHYTEDVRVDDIASEAYFSKYHFIRLFRMAYGRTPHQYLQWVRLEHARRLLQEEAISVTEVCYAVGFNSPGSFSSLFKKHTGQSPAGYRENWRRRQQMIREAPLAWVPGCFRPNGARAAE